MALRASLVVEGTSMIPPHTETEPATQERVPRVLRMRPGVGQDCVFISAQLVKQSGQVQYGQLRSFTQRA